jgi:tricarballylate dehydrogenase
MAEYDVIVAGGGNAGLCAALSASDAGARVLLVERSPTWRRGGNSRHTRDIRYAHAEPQRWASAPYPIAEFSADLDAVTAPRRPDLADLMVRESQALPQWMEEHGVRWQNPMNGTLHLHTNRFFLGGGKAMINSYYDTAIRGGVEVRYDTSVRELEISDGHCSVAHLENGSGRDAVEAGAVVVTSGGLEANHKWLAETWGDGAKNFIIRGTPDNDGSLLLLLLAHGAARIESRLFHCVGVDARSPRFDGGIVTRVDSIPFGVAVNKHGKRFYDEGEDAWPKRYAQWGQLIANQPDQLAYSIFDSRSRGLFIPSMVPPFSAGTLEELVSLLDLDGAETLRTIESFNAAVDDTNPFDPSRPDGRSAPGIEPPRRNWARRIELPPFLAYPLRPGLTFTYAGVGVDEKARIARTDGTTFANVFAAGEVMAGNILTHGYLAGVGLTIGSVFGRIAGREAAKAAGA